MLGSRLTTLWPTLHAWVNSLTWSDLWSAKTAFLVTPTLTWKLQWVAIGFLALCLVSGIGTAIRTRLYAPYRQQLLAYFWTNAILGSILVFFRLQRIPVLGMDIIRSCFLVGSAIWAILILRYRLTAYRKDRLTMLVTARRQKYLPGSQKSVTPAS